jgi:hypothetical protein
MGIATVEQFVPPLVAGDFLSRDEFLRRWEAMPQIKRAELIQGVVYMPSPLSLEHGDTDSYVGTWIGVYAAATPGLPWQRQCYVADGTEKRAATRQIVAHPA